MHHKTQNRSPVSQTPNKGVARHTNTTNASTSAGKSEIHRLRQAVLRSDRARMANHGKTIPNNRRPHRRLING